MKALERIFLYSVLAILVFYVFLVDGNVESQVAIQEEIRARYIAIVNDEGREVIMLSADKDGNGGIMFFNNNNIPVVWMGVDELGGMMSVGNKAGNPTAFMRDSESGGTMGIRNKDDNLVFGIMGVTENDNGGIVVFNKDGKVIGSLP